VPTVVQRDEIVNAEFAVPFPKAPRSLDDLAELPRWVAWREEIRERQDGSKYPAKMPYDPNSNGQARIPSDPATYGTRAEAQRRWRELDDGSCGGVGIVLGDLGTGYHLLGVDLDRCVHSQPDERDIRLTKSANEIVDRFATYAEISPSGKGVKLFFLVKDHDIVEVDELLQGKTRKTFAATEHREIAVDRARFYAVTDDRLEGWLRVVPVKAIRWLVQQAGPDFLARFGCIESAQAEARRGRDESGSGYGYRYFAGCKALRRSYSEARKAILADPGPAGEWANRVDERLLERTWREAKPYLERDFVIPKRWPRHVEQMTAKQLESIEFPPLKYVVPKLLVEGLTILAGKPKIGKSFLMLQVANAVANGASTLGGISCEQGDVLYAALEDYNLRRVQSRIRQMNPRQWSDRLTIMTHLPRLDEGGLQIIRDWISEVERPRLIIIDIFARVKPKSSQRDGQNQYDFDYDSVIELQQLAMKYALAVVIVAHVRKAEADDIFDTVSGTLGFTAAADSVLILSQGPGGYELHARGRDLPELVEAAQFDRGTGKWKLLGSVEQARQTRERGRIVESLRNFDHPASAGEIASIIGAKAANVSKLLAKLVREGHVYRHDYGKYSLAPAATSHRNRRAERES
jgi:AAA domain